MDGAAVSAACILVGPTNEQNIRSIIFTDAKKFSEPGAKIAEVKELLSHGVIPDLCHIVTHEALLRLPRKIFAYWLTENLIKIFSCITRLA